MKQAIELKPELTESFRQAIKHLKGAPATDANKAEGRAIIEHYTSRLQLLDLELSQAEARALLAFEYSSI
jgi:hypothetical protein